MKLTYNLNLTKKIIYISGLILVNLLIMFLFGFLTLDVEANLNSRFGALVLSIILALFLSLLTREMPNYIRMISFGSGAIIYIILAIIIIGFYESFSSGLVISLLTYLAVLYFGNLFTLK